MATLVKMRESRPATETVMPPLRHPAGPDLISLAEVCRRLELTARTVKRLHHEHGLPLMRFTGGGGYFALWSEIETWARTQRNGHR